MDSSMSNNLALQMIMSKLLITDNIIINALICLIVPIIISNIYKLYPYLEKLSIKSLNPVASRNIIYRYRDESPSWYYCKKTNRNDILQKAVMMYISYMTNNDKMIVFDDADVSFMALEAEKESNRYHDYNSYKTGNSQIEELRKLKRLSLPSENIWAKLKNDIRLLISDGIDQDAAIHSKNGDEPMPVQRVKNFHFRASNPGGSIRIDNFLDEAVAWYISSLNQEEDNNRYLYIVENQNEANFIEDSKNSERRGKSNAKSSAAEYKRYALSETKKFSNLFFPQKQALQDLLDNFQNCQGKYAIDGYPHKLGLLLFGEPGTGKTSLIRALAQYLKRHIVSINLSQIKTNQQLFDIVHNHAYAVNELEFPVKLTFKDVVFVFEDIDACSDIVLSRKEKNSNSDTNSSIVSDDQSSTKEEDSLSAVAAVAAVVAAVNNSKAYDKDKKDQENLLDKLNLSGLLNVLDGIVDTPNRVIVMTTNHPEKLDRALIRPGRIDKSIYMGLMKAQCASEMIKHYFAIEDLDNTQFARLEALVGVDSNDSGTLKDQASPAYIEQKCAESSTVDELLDALEGKVIDTTLFDNNNERFSKSEMFAINRELYSINSQDRRAVSC
jgi:chaperone BCS1